MDDPVQEQLDSDAGLKSAYENALANKDWSAFRGILRQLGANDAYVERQWNWIWHSPHSWRNSDPIRLAPALEGDPRIHKLRDREKRIAQYLFEEYGGVGGEPCLWDGCGRPTLRGLAYCAHCAVVHARLYLRSGL